jgi:hypothetical protein
MANLISFKELYEKLNNKEDRAVLEDVIMRLSRCQVCSILDKWMGRETDSLVQKEILKCVNIFNELIKKYEHEGYIPTDDIVKTREIIGKMMLEYIGKDS